MKNISYLELVNCQDYAQRVIRFYKHCNNGQTPNASEAELIVREYNKDFRQFKTLYGYSIRGYIPIIAEQIGFIVEA